MLSNFLNVTVGLSGSVIMGPIEEVVCRLTYVCSTAILTGQGVPAERRGNSSGTTVNTQRTKKRTASIRWVRFSIGIVILTIRRINRPRMGANP